MGMAPTPSWRSNGSKAPTYVWVVVPNNQNPRSSAVNESENSSDCRPGNVLASTSGRSGARGSFRTRRFCLFSRVGAPTSGINIAIEYESAAPPSADGSPTRLRAKSSSAIAAAACRAMNDLYLSRRFFAIVGVSTFLMVAVSSQECRLSSTKQKMAPREFESYACGECLYYIYFVAPIGPYAVNYRSKPCPGGLLICPKDKAETDWCDCDNPQAVFNVQDYALSNTSSTPLEQLVVHPPLPSGFIHFTTDCCWEAARCCREILQKDDQFKASRHCPATWDGWQCFDRTKPSTVPANCPNYIYGDKMPYNEEFANYAIKKCEPSGKWFSVNYADKMEIEWTDYSLCLVRESYVIKFIVGVVSFGVSVIAIIPALIIMSSYRLLKTQDVFVLHRNLLTSFLLCGVFFIFNSFFFVVDGGPGEGLYLSNHISCRILFTIQLRYLRLSSYTWMLSEGWYLHRLLIAAFAAPKSLRNYHIVCWGFPIIPTALYSVFRALYDDSDCWVAPSQEAWIDWIITGPCLAALCMNLILMVAILYILIRKLRFSPDLEPVQYRKAVRATFILLPVFGLHFLLTIYRLPILAHEIFNMLLDGLQGFFVAVIICYTNGRVIECLHKTWQARKDQHDIRRQSIANRVSYRKSTDLGRTNETESMVSSNERTSLQPSNDSEKEEKLITMAMDERRPSNTSSNTSQHLQVPSQVQ